MNRQSIGSRTTARSTVSLVALLLLVATLAPPTATATPSPSVLQPAAVQPVRQGAQIAVTLNPVADATIAQGSPNLGGDSFLWLQMGIMQSRSAPNAGAGSPEQKPAGFAWSPTQNALLRFDLGLPGSAVIDAARLVLRLNWPPGPDYVVVRAIEVTSAWSEMDVTWSNKPALGSRYALANVGAGVWYAWDVTEIARAWQQGPNYGLQLEPDWPTDSVWSLAFLSRNAGLDPPQLVVTYHLPGPTLYAPSTGRPGAELSVAGENYTPGAAITLQLERSGSSWPCGSASAAATGTLRTRCTVPLAMPVGPAYLSARAAIGGAVLASAAVQILAGPTLQLSPVSGPPGTVVQYTATNLVAGSLRLDYASVPIVGPLPTSGGTAVGTFVVPGDRPNPLGATTTVKAVNRAGGLAVAVGEAPFQSQAALPPDLSFMQMTAPGGHIIPGEEFTVVGQIAGATGAALQGYQVTAMWQDSTGRSVPIGQPGAVGSDGRFQVQARAPSLLSGDAWSSSGGSDLLLLTVRKPGREAAARGIVQYHGPYTPTLEVHVTDSGAPHADIEGARVRLTPDVSIHAAVESGQNQTNILDETPEERLQRELDEFQCVDLLDQLTTTDGEAELSMSNVEDPSSHPQWDVVLDNANTPISGAGVRGRGGDAGASSSILAPPPPNPPVGPQWKHYRVTVDGSRVGYNLPDSAGGWHPYRIDVYFNTRTGDILDAWSSNLGNPLEVALDKIPPDQQPFDFAPMFDSGSLEAGQPPTYGTFLTFPGLSGSGVSLPGEHLGIIYFGLTDAQYDALDSARLRIGTHDLGAFSCYPGGFQGDALNPQDDVCAPDPVNNIEASYYQAACKRSVPIDNDWAEGVHDLTVVAKLKSGAEKTRSLRVRTARAPAWFLQSEVADRKAERLATGYLLSENVISAPQAVDASSNASQTPQTGAMANHAELARLYHEEFIYFTTNAIARGDYLINGIRALDNEADPVQGKGVAESPVVASAQSFSAPIAGPQSPGAPASSYRIPLKYGPVDLFDTGTIDMGQVSLDILGVVQITAGREGGFSASIAADGYIDPGATPKIQYDTRPAARAWGFLWVEAGILEVVGKVRTGVGYDLNVALTFSLEDYSPGLSDPCFTYQGYFKAYAGAICWPGDGCLLKKSSTVPWTPQPLTLPPGCTIRSSSAPMAALEDEGDPPQIGAALASDGFGHSAALWPGDIDALTATLYDGISWSSAYTIPTGTGPTDPAVAFYAPNRAVAAWAESSLPAPETPPTIDPTLTYTDVLQSYHIAYSLWDGTQWSAAQHLTLPTTPGTGEGKVALAACPSTATGCPAGGAITAVWVRDVAGAPAQRQYRLYYATYQGGAWSAPKPVDPASTATDTQPSVAYRLGQPLVAWVRDVDRNANTAQDRRIAWKTLDGTGSVNVPADLPGGIIDLSLAVDSAGVRQLAFTRSEDAAVGVIDSRHPLYRAYATCTQTCNWTYDKLLDSRGRTLHAEAPRLTIDNLDRATITYRALGFGRDPAASPFAYPEDSTGVIVRSGDLAQVELPAVTIGQTFEVSQNLEDLTTGQTATVSPSYLTSDGAVNWEPLASYDALSDSTIGLAVQGAAPAGAAGMPAHQQQANVATSLAAGEPLVVANVARQPDLTVVTATVSSRYPAPGEPLTLTVAVRNDGAGFTGLLGPLVELVGTWDGGPGLGAPAYSHAVSAPQAGQVVTYTVPLAAPPPVSDHAPVAAYAAPHTLTVSINPTQTLAERNGANNSVTLPLGGLPIPTDLTASPARNSLVALQWTAPAAGAVAGYRIYRSADGGSSLPAGSSFVAGWVDLTAQPGHRYQYTVVSYAANGLEGEPSEVRQVTLPATKGYTYLPLVRR